MKEDMNVKITCSNTAELQSDIVRMALYAKDLSEQQKATAYKIIISLMAQAPIDKAFEGT